MTSPQSCCLKHLVKRVPPGDTLPRDYCEACDTVFYKNPKIVAGVLPLYNNRVLLCKRAIEPKKNYWTLPSGYMECNETLKEAALREAKEEAGITPTIQSLHTIYDLPHIGQVYFLFLAQCDTDAHEPGAETIESKWVDIEDIPYSLLAFSPVYYALKRLHITSLPTYGCYPEH